VRKILFVISLVLGCLLLPELSIAQNPGNPIANRGFYRTMNMYGGYVHTAGLGIYYRRGWRQTGFTNRIMNFELLTLNHPKQFKVALTQRSTQNGYFLNKINSVIMLRGSFGFQKTWFDKEVKRGVRVSTFFLFGPSIALAKPVFMNVNFTDAGLSTEKYADIVNLSNVQILEKAPYLIGVSETVPYPGAHVKVALNFEYSPDDEFIRALETGATFDVFPKKIPIMANTYNDQFYITLYVAFHFGRRYL
jgi:hypothetical protein